jgi:putative DNA primase/helicase
MGRRFLLVPWEQQIPKAERDKTLKARIIALEAEGVLAWLIRGAMQWTAQGGLITPAEVVKRSEAHIREADPVWPFIHERLIADPHCETEFTAIYGAYESWCSLNGQRNPMSGKALSMALSERLGHEIRAKNPKTRRSVFRLRLNLMAVPTAHEKFFVGEAR